MNTAKLNMALPWGERTQLLPKAMVYAFSLDVQALSHGPYLKVERSPELGVTVLKEGTTSILFGRPPTAELHGTWREGVYKGTRLGPSGQRREEFEFSEEFPSLDGLSTSVRCEAKEARYRSRLSLAVEKGMLKSLEWRVVEPGGQACSVSTAEQQPMRGREPRGHSRGAVGALQEEERRDPDPQQRHPARKEHQPHLGGRAGGGRVRVFGVNTTHRIHAVNRALGNGNRAC